MKINELRLGNIISGANPEFYGFVRSLDSEGKVYYECLDYPSDNGLFELDDHLFPVKLTEDWLLRFAFKKVITKRSTCFSLGDFHLYQIVLKGELLGYSYQLDDGAGVLLSYVHTLQNFYFSINSVEL